MIYAGIDLHSNNMVIVAINDKDKVLREAKLPSSKRALDDFFNTFDEPARAVVAKELAKGVWYMLSKDQEYKGFSQGDLFGEGAPNASGPTNLLAAAYKL